MLDATPALRCYARWRLGALAVEDPVAAQRRQLLRLIRRAEETAFGRAHRFSHIQTVHEFQERVPLRHYEDFWRDWWQPVFPQLTNVTWPGSIPYFALSSGTSSGTTKYIPVSRQMVSSNRRAALDILVHHLAARPDSRVLAGRNFMLGGSTDLKRERPGIYSGDLSGIAAREVPWWARARYFPPPELALIADWERKMEVLGPLSLSADIRSIGGTPSWVLWFFGRLAELRPELPPRVGSWYPDLELYVHGGVNFSPYRTQFEALFEGTPVAMREVYPASEGFMAIADQGYGEGLRLLVDNGLFLEFVPVEEIDAGRPTRHWMPDIEPDVNYAVVLSSNAGLWSIVVGDTVRFVSIRPPRVLVTGRLSYMLSAFGEHLIAEEIENAMLAASRVAGVQATEFTATAIYPAHPGELGRHAFVVEFAREIGAAALVRFREALDAALSAENEDYRAHRSGLRQPVLTAVSAGSFGAWMKHRGRAGGQNKVPRVINDTALFADLLAFMRAEGRVVSEVG
jgi:hypothetical protein